MRQVMQGAARRAREAARAGRDAHRSGDVARAERLYAEALAEDEGEPEALFGLGCLAFERGDNARAIGLIGRALERDRERAPFHVVLGLALLGEGHGEAARAALSLATLRAPNDAHAHFQHARVLAHLGRDQEAEAAFARAATLAPSAPEIRNEQGTHLMGRGKPRAALDAFRAADAFRPGDPVILGNLGAALQALGRDAEALDALDASLARAPDQAEPLSNRGLARLALGELDAALDDLGRAAKAAPANVAAVRNFAAGLYELDRLDEAEAILEALRARAPDDPATILNRATIALARGDLAAGWPGYEARLRLNPPPVRAGVPAWSGEALGGPLLLEAEQGIGDTLMFLRYVPGAAARAGAGLVLALPPSLHRTARHVAPDATLVAAEDVSEVALGDVAARAALGSLPRLFSPTLEDIPPPFRPWFDPALVPTRTDDRLRVGIAWSGNPLYKQDRRRSIALELLAPLATVPHVALISLQQGETARPDGVAKPPFALGDFADTAALIASLDLVVTVDTALVHLAGSLGVPTWLLDRAGGDWRWLRGRDTSPWYPTLRIFRQAAARAPREAWPPVIAELRDRLGERARARG